MFSVYVSLVEQSIVSFLASVHNDLHIFVL